MEEERTNRNAQTKNQETNTFMTNYRYMLDSPRITGRRQVKTTCPHCGRHKCFVRYVDTRKQCEYLSDEVGRCDHEQSCGYHNRPSEYFRDHPWMAEGAYRSSAQRPIPIKPAPPTPSPIQPLPMSLVQKYHSPASVFWQWLTGDCARQLRLDAKVLSHIFDEYYVGATQAGHVVFWQIDEQQRVRTGQIMQYSPHGKRYGYRDWIHSVLMKANQLPTGFQLRQCLFGQHLLPKYPDKHVCIVESQKTALIMAAIRPDMLWLATCGCSGLSSEKVECLRGRRFTLFPDSGCYDKWNKIMSQTQGLLYNIDNSLEQYPSNTDLADLLLKPP